MDGAKISPKSSTLWIGRNNVTYRRQTDDRRTTDGRQTDGSCHKENVT